MDDATPDAAQARADDIRAFRRELARLEREQVVTLDDHRRERIDQHHRALLADFTRRFDIDTDNRAAQLSLGLRIASLLGALALAASIYFFFYRVWGLLPTTAQVTLLAGAPLAALALTARLQARDASGYFTRLAAFATFACFVLNIVMLAQIFNLRPADAALLPWGALALLLAYGGRLRLLLVAGMLCLIAWFAARTASWAGFPGFDGWQRPEHFFPAALLLLACARIDHARFPGFSATYRLGGWLTLLLPVLLLAHWGHGSYLPLADWLIELIYQFAGFALATLAIWTGIRKPWPETRNAGVVFFVVFLYSTFFDWWWNLLPKYLFFLLLALVTVLVIAILRRLRAYAGDARP